MTIVSNLQNNDGSQLSMLYYFWTKDIKMAFLADSSSALTLHHMTASPSNTEMVLISTSNKSICQTPPTTLGFTNLLLTSLLTPIVTPQLTQPRNRSILGPTDNTLTSNRFPYQFFPPLHTTMYIFWQIHAVEILILVSSFPLQLYAQYNTDES